MAEHTPNIGVIIPVVQRELEPPRIYSVFFYVYSPGQCLCQKKRKKTTLNRSVLIRFSNGYQFKSRNLLVRKKKSNNKYVELFTVEPISNNSSHDNSEAIGTLSLVFYFKSLLESGASNSRNCHLIHFLHHAG